MTARAPQRVAGVPIRYEVYLDNVKLGDTTDKEWLLEGLEAGNHTAGVKAVYASGVSEMAVVSFTLITSGIMDSVSESLRIVSSDDCLTVYGVASDDEIALYDVAGISYPMKRGEGMATVDGIATGNVYVLRVNGHTYRIMH